jgi:hypothetical protein
MASQPPPPLRTPDPDVLARVKREWLVWAGSDKLVHRWVNHGAIGVERQKRRPLTSQTYEPIIRKHGNKPYLGGKDVEKEIITVQQSMFCLFHSANFTPQEETPYLGTRR